MLHVLAVEDGVLAHRRGSARVGLVAVSIVRLWVSFDSQDLTTAQTREAFIEAIRTAITTAQYQGRLDRAVAEQLRYALVQREPPT